MISILNDWSKKASSFFKREPAAHNNAKRARRASAFPPAETIGRTEELVDIAALIGEAVALNNGTFVRLLEVWPVDLEGAEASQRRQYWIRFANALRRLPAPMTVQVVVTFTAAGHPTLSGTAPRDRRALERAAPARAGVSGCQRSAT